MFIDTHAHLNMPDYIDLNDVIERAKQAKIEAIINVGFDLDSSKASVKLSSDFDFIFSSVGIHPHDASSDNSAKIDELKKLAKNDKVVAIGETGLDYYKNLSPKDAQVDLFLKHIALAQDLSLPLIIHARRSYEDVLKILHEEGRGKLTGVMHCFSGDANIARLCLDLGFYISIAGPVTFKKADDLREIAKFVPIDRLLIETDCPYLAPDPNRGKRNEPSFMISTAKKIAEIRGLKLEDFALKTTENAKRLFTKLKS